MFFLSNQWITKKEVQIFATMMIITTIITGLFLIKWYYNLLISLLFLTIGQNLIRVINYVNLVILFFLSLIGFTITMLVIII